MRQNQLRYLAFHKPYGVLCQFTDEEGRPTLKDYIDIPDVYSVGRLDMDSEGLLLLTDDGTLNRRLAEPRFHQPKIYFVQIEGAITPEAIHCLEQGVNLGGYHTLPCQVTVMADPGFAERSKPITPHAPPSWIRIVLHEGKKRQIRHMTAAVGFPTLRLIRVAIGTLKLGDLAPGAWRMLTQAEINALRTVNATPAQNLRR